MIEAMETGDEPMIDTQQLSEALGIPKMTLWRRAKAGVIPSHWEYRHALDKKPRLRFRLSEVKAAIADAGQPPAD
jgi:predicted DNA-binding transcriptional regulator AlpA